jgi:hypothetical protein
MFSKSLREIMGEVRSPLYRFGFVYGVRGTGRQGCGNNKLGAPAPRGSPLRFLYYSAAGESPIMCGSRPRELHPIHCSRRSLSPCGELQTVHTLLFTVAFSVLYLILYAIPPPTPCHERSQLQWQSFWTNQCQNDFQLSKFRTSLYFCVTVEVGLSMVQEL